MENYKEKLRKISTQTREEGREYIAEFLEDFMEKTPVVPDLCDLLFRTIESATEEVISVYYDLLKNKMSTEWYSVISFINDEKKEPELYYSVILNCMDVLSPEKVRILADECHSADEFQQLVKREMEENSEVCANLAQGDSVTQDTEQGEEDCVNPAQSDLLVFLKEENERLNRRLDRLLSKSDMADRSSRKLMEENLSNKRLVAELNKELRDTRRKQKQSEYAVELAERTAKRYKRMLEQMERINLRIQSENKELRANLAQRLNPQFHHPNISAFTSNNYSFLKSTFHGDVYEGETLWAFRSGHSFRQVFLFRFHP